MTNFLITKLKSMYAKDVYGMANKGSDKASLHGHTISHQIEQ